FQISRLFTTAREVFAARGLGSVEGHLIAYAKPDVRLARLGVKNRLTFSAGFLLKKSPFRPEDLQRIRAILRIGAPPAPGDAANVFLYAPGETHAGSIYDR